MIRRITTIMISMIVAVAATAQAANWIPDYSQSSVKFRAQQQGVEFIGAFEKFSIDIKLDPNDPSTGSITATIEMSSADAGDRDRNNALPTRDWFSTKKFPTAEFRSQSIIADGEGSFIATGTLSMKGVEKGVTLPFTLAIDGDHARASGVASLNRTDFKVGDGAFKTGDWVALNVDVLIDIVATRAADDE